MTPDEEKEFEHIRIAKKLDDLDALRPKVIAGFAIFWVLLILAFVGTVDYYFI